MKYFYKFLFILLVLIAGLMGQNTTKPELPDSVIRRLDSMGNELGEMILKFERVIAYSDSEFVEIDTQKVLFEKGVKMYNMGQFITAENIFKNIVSPSGGESHYLSASLLMLAKTYFQLGKIEKCLSLGFDFEMRFPTSDYLDDIRFMIGESYFVTGDYSNALLYFISVLKKTRDEKLRKKVIDVIDTLVDLFLTIDDLKRINITISDTFFDNYLKLKLAEKYNSEGVNNQATSLYNNLVALAYSPILKEEYIRTGKRLQKRGNRKNYIGVVLPLTGYMKETGEKILNGVRYAIHKHRELTGQDIALLVLDNQGDMAQSIKHMQFLTKNPKILAIFGPVTSENSIALGGLANQIKIPIITPTATSDKITELGPWVFQANLNFGTAGKFLGEYCSHNLGLQTVASISSGDEYGKKVTDAFLKTVDMQGTKIVSQQWYTGAPENLKLQFENVRKAGLELMREQLDDKFSMMRDSLKILEKNDSLWSTDSLYLFIQDSVCQIFEKDSVYELSIKEALIFTGLMDSLEFLIPEKKDSIELKINSIDAILIPAYLSDLDLLIPQMEFYNFNTRFLGNQNWNNLKILQKNRRLLDGLIFVSDYYIDETSIEFKTFRAKYFNLLGHTPKLLNFYGYDTMSALLSCCRSDDLNRERVWRNLSTMDTYHGIARNISFKGSRRRMNSCAYILSFQNNKIEPVAVFEKGIIIAEPDSVKVIDSLLN